MNYTTHEFADIFPMMSDEQYASLISSMAASGFDPIFPIILYAGKILDGRNRYKAALQANVIPIFQDFEGNDTEALDFVMRANFERRHLPASQRGVVALRYEEELAKIAKAKQKEAGKYGAEGAEFGALGGRGNKKNVENPLPPNSVEGGLNASRNNESAKKAADMVNIGKTTIHTLKNIKKTAPEVIELIEKTGITTESARKIAELPPETRAGVIQKVENGEDANKAVKAIKIDARRAEIEKQAAEIENGIDKPAGLFDVIVIDPPWNYGRDYDPDTSRVANPYPEIPQSELLKLEIPAKENCALFLWTTHAFLWDAKDLLDKWGFQYKAMLIWDKEKMGMGDWLRMQCEFCLIGIKGRPFWDNTAHRDIIREARREHSRKPEAFYFFVESVTAGRKLDFFSRGKRDGWESYGNDTNKF